MTKFLFFPHGGKNHGGNGTIETITVDGNDVASKLMRFYQTYKPQKATQANVTKILTKYRGQEIK